MTYDKLVKFLSTYKKCSIDNIIKIGKEVN